MKGDSDSLWVAKRLREALPGRPLVYNAASLIERLASERGTYKAALERIARIEGRKAGRIAREALSTEAGYPLTPESPVSESRSGVVCRPTEGSQQ